MKFEISLQIEKQTPKVDAVKPQTPTELIEDYIWAHFPSLHTLIKSMDLVLEKHPQHREFYEKAVIWKREKGYPPSWDI